MDKVFYLKVVLNQKSLKTRMARSNKNASRRRRSRMRPIVNTSFVQRQRQAAPRTHHHHSRLPHIYRHSTQRAARALRDERDTPPRDTDDCSRRYGGAEILTKNPC